MLRQPVNVTMVIDWQEDIYDILAMSKCNGRELLMIVCRSY